MRIGIVCEGATDVHAIECFLKASLRSRGLDARFVRLQPRMDRTSPRGGWTMMFKWFEKNPPDTRIRTYFDGGLFDHGLSAMQCDVMLFQMDVDILSDEAFRNHIRRQFVQDVGDPDDPVERGQAVRGIIEMAGDFGRLSERDLSRHIVAPSVESTETWCVAVFRNLESDPELLRGQDLCNAFMTVLHQSEGRRMQPFANVDKSPERRYRFCDRHSGGFERLERQCFHYRALVESLT